MIYQKSPAFPRIAPFTVYICFLALNSLLMGLAGSAGLDANWLYGARVGAVALILFFFWRSYSELEWPVVMPLRLWLISAAIGAAVFVIWIMPYPQWAMQGVTAGYSPMRADGSIEPTLAIIRVAGAALVVPLMEELFWRSYIMRMLDTHPVAGSDGINREFLSTEPAATSLKALTITAVLFAIEHNLWLAGLLAGLVYGWLYKVGRTLWAPIIAHAVTNFMLGLWVLENKAWRYW